MSDIEKVKQLREATGAGFKDCNLAIKESNGDLDKAIEILRVKGISKASKKMSRDAKEGVIAVSGDDIKTSVIEINCETDFVAKNDDFISFAKELSELNNKSESDLEKLNKNFRYLHTVVKDNLSKLAVIVTLETKDSSEAINSFGKQLAMHVAASNPLALESNLIDKETIDKEVSLIAEELKNSGKPEEIAKKISLGKINKFKEENGLLSQAWVMEPKKKVQDILKELAINDLKIKDFYRLKIGE